MCDCHIYEKHNLHCGFLKPLHLKATSHTRLRACDHYTSSTPIGGKGRAGPSLLHTALEGPTEYVNPWWMLSLHRFLRGTKWIMFHGHLDYSQTPPLGCRLNTKPLGDHGTPNASKRWLILFYHVRGPAWIEIRWISIRLRSRSHTASHYTWESVTTLHYMILEVPWDGGLWTLSFGLSLSHRHGSWLVCELPSIPILNLTWLGYLLFCDLRLLFVTRWSNSRSNSTGKSLWSWKVPTIEPQTLFGMKWMKGQRHRGWYQAVAKVSIKSKPSLKLTNKQKLGSLIWSLASCYLWW